jgi:hypothetical protein
MKRNLLPAALLAAAGVTLSPGHARAQSDVPATNGDLILGFEESGVSNNLEVNLGSYATYLDATSAFNVTFGVIPSTSTVVTNLNADLTNVFTSGWATNTGTPVVEWGIVGATPTTVSGVSTDDVFFTQDASNTTPIENPNNAGATADATDINTSYLAGLSVQTSSTNSTESAVVPTSYSNSYTSWNSQDFGSGLDIENLGGPTNSTLDLFELEPTGRNPNGSDATEIGSFALNSAGDLTFTPESVPEPSTWLSFIGGALFLGLFRLRRNRRIS